ncbi:unnamed protein product, partial [marine sediment metagenome]
TTGWGIDPYHPNIDKLQKLVVKDDKGDFSGTRDRPALITFSRSSLARAADMAAAMNISPYMPFLAWERQASL